MSTIKLPAKRSRWRRRCGYVVLLGVIVVNVVAYNQARTMLNYSAASMATPTIEELTFGQKVQTVLFGVAVPRPTNMDTPADYEWNYEVATLATSRGDLEAWIIPHDEQYGIALLFHGYAASKESLLPVAATMRTMGYTTVLVDFYGSGGSAGATTTLGATEATDVQTALAYVRDRWPDQPLVVYGFSMGAAAVVRGLATSAIQPHAIILEAPFDRLATTVRHRFAALGLPTFPSAELLLFWGSVQAGFNGFALNPIDDARQITSPTLLLRGALDPRVTSDEVRSFSTAIRATTTFVEVPNVAHAPSSVAAPAAWEQAVRSFLAHVEERHK